MYVLFYGHQFGPQKILQGLSDCKDSDYISYNLCFCRSIQVQDEEEISVELIEERERAIRQLEVCVKENMHDPFVYP